MTLQSSSCRLKSKKEVKPGVNKLDFKKIPEFYAKIIPDSLTYLIPIFDTILSDDQKYREINNPELYEHNSKEQSRLDSINIIKVEKIISKHGWLTYNQSGNKGSLALTSVLLHTNVKMQEKYLPLLLQAFEEKKVNGVFISTFEDRLNVRKLKLQRYGTQIINYKNKLTLFPVQNIDSIDIWRKKRGFISPIEFTLRNTFKTDFDKNDYMKQLPDLMKFCQVSRTF